MAADIDIVSIRGLDIFRLKLHRGEMKLAGVVQYFLPRLKYFLRTGVVLNLEVCGEYVCPRRDHPGVRVMDILHSLKSCEIGSDLFQVNSLRGRLK